VLSSLRWAVQEAKVNKSGDVTVWQLIRPALDCFLRPASVENGESVRPFKSRSESIGKERKHFIAES
jgi:hypothetical protein